MINYGGQVLNGPNGQSGSLQFVTVTGNYDVTEADSGKVLLVTATSVITLPSSTPAEGFYVEVIRMGAGTASFQAGAGATVVSSAGATPGIAAQYQGATCTKLAGEQWIVIGGIA
mgnify:FL=1